MLMRAFRVTNAASREGALPRGSRDQLPGKTEMVSGIDGINPRTRDITAISALSRICITPISQILSNTLLSA